ncbi:hypothetical protein K3495_g6594 [Podosphaera aphanis]|nr:hypothetical protein K3495_g6594 [Podosphaera aphanis]
MFSRAVTRTTSMVSVAGRQVRGFHMSKALKSSPYHYPEGPRSNLPFNPLTKFFFVRYWVFMGVGFFAPFGIAVWQTKKNR